MVSIIIPYYNRPEKLNRCLDSVLGQTYQDFEILVVDDYSEVPLTLNLDPRIKIFRNSVNLGPGLSRNVGLENAKGKYIAFLDSDDYWDSQFIQTCINEFETVENNPVMVFTNTLSISNEGSSPKRKWKEITETILPNILINKRPWATSSCLWRADLVENVKWINSRNWEDYAFDVSVALKCNNVSQIDKFLVFYDAEGDDKLSNQKFEISIINQNTSILHISDSLFHSEFRNHSEVRNAIKILLINHIISIVRSKKKDKRLIQSITVEFKKWSSNSLGLYIDIINIFPTNIQLRSLRDLKSRIREDSF